MAREVSDFALADEVAEVYPGMMLAVPPAVAEPGPEPRHDGVSALECVARTGSRASDVPMPRRSEEASSEAEFRRANPSRLQQEGPGPGAGPSLPITRRAKAHGIKELSDINFHVHGGGWAPPTVFGHWPGRRRRVAWAASSTERVLPPFPAETASRYAEAGPMWIRSRVRIRGQPWIGSCEVSRSLIR